VDQVLRISRAGPERLDELEPLWHAVQQHHAALAPTLAGFEARPLQQSWIVRRRRYARELTDPGAFVLIAEHGAVPVGYALVSLTDSPAGWSYGERIAELETLSVLPHARGHGIGTKLMDAVEEELSNLGVQAVRVRVIEANPDALRFYERRNLQLISRVLLGRIDIPRRPD
jgi:ribosomal protein S18 acetylase RimI-like enzyme